MPDFIDKLYDASSILADNPPEKQWLVKDLIPAGYVLMLFSPEGIGKSVFAYNLALSMATGTSFLGLQTQPGRVLYMDEENPDSYVYEILASWCRARTIKPETLSGRLTIGRFALLGYPASHWSPLLASYVKVAAPSLIIFDTFSSLLPFVENIENDSATMKGLLRAIRNVKGDVPSATILILHHPAKGDNNRPRGSGSIGQDVDGYWSLKNAKGHPTADEKARERLLEPGKSRGLAGVPTYRIKPIRPPHGGYDLTASIDSLRD